MSPATRPPGSGRLRRAATTAAVGALVAAPALVTVATATPAAALVDNPFVGATQYVNPDWVDSVEGAAAQVQGSNPGLAADMLALTSEPTSLWVDRIAAIAGTDRQHGLQWHLDQALAQQQGSTPIVFNIVIYDLPGRDCHALASNGELPATAEGLQRYKTEYIDPITALLDQPAYEGIRFVATIEPDSLPNLVTNMSDADCAQSAPYYREGVRYALDQLYEVGNVYSYIDAGHSGWLGWDNNSAGAASEFASVIGGSTYGWNAVAGFVTNTANTTPLVEPFLPNPELQVSGQQVRQATYYEWNRDFDEIDWSAHLYQLMVAQGAPASIGMLVDTGRNGWGGAARPTAVSTSTDLNTYVNQSRIDRRAHRGAWCNPSGAGIGERPTVAPAGYASSHLDAFVWVKPPGESDGSSTEIPNDEGKRLDRMCDPTYASDALGGNLTGALPGAPLSGHWFQAQFEMLVANAYPAIGDGGTPTDTQAPTVPAGLTVGTVTSSSVALSWSASTDNVGVTGYDVLRNGTVVGTATGTSFTATGLTASTAYQFSVRARDAAGNVSAASAAVTATTTAGTGTGACAATFRIVNSWTGGFQAEVVVTAAAAKTGWTTEFTLPAGVTLGSLWNGSHTVSGSTVTVTNLGWNGNIGPSSSAAYGFTANGTAPSTPPSVTCS